MYNLFASNTYVYFIIIHFLIAVYYVKVEFKSILATDVPIRTYQLNNNFKDVTSLPNLAEDLKSLFGCLFKRTINFQKIIFLYLIAEFLKQVIGYLLS